MTLNLFSVEGSKLDGANFAGCTFTEPSFAMAKLPKANFAAADLTLAEFNLADVSGASFAGYVIRDPRV